MSAIATIARAGLDLRDFRDRAAEIKAARERVQKWSKFLGVSYARAKSSCAMDALAARKRARRQRAIVDAVCAIANVVAVDYSDRSEATYVVAKVAGGYKRIRFADHAAVWECSAHNHQVPLSVLRHEVEGCLRAERVSLDRVVALFRAALETDECVTALSPDAEKSQIARICAERKIDMRNTDRVAEVRGEVLRNAAKKAAL